MNIEQIDEMLAQLKDTREKAAFYRAEANAILNNAKNSPNFELADQAAKEAQENIEALEVKIKANALLDYRINQNKHPHPKVDIAMRKKFNITDPIKVLLWVKNNLADALIYDEKKIKNYATKIGPIDGTELTEEPNAQIASEL